jgi:oxygen-independent coproporphyrinogen-3 oxidase
MENDSASMRCATSYNALMSSIETKPRGSPRSAYVHVPFCARRCGYCNFTLVAGRDDLVDPYLDALARELAFLEMPREVDTLFLGGGTPTQIKGDRLHRLLALVLDWHPLAQRYEFSVEANPSDVDRDMAATLAEYGVNRVSLGAQSFRDEKLRALERDHSADQIYRATSYLRERGMSVSLDLIFAAPGETPADWEYDLAAAMALSPQHISTYDLTFERGTTFWTRRLRRELVSADDELERSMYETAIERLTAAGFQHYEVSNFSLPGQRCRHNETYWLGEEYYAVGPGAARYIGGVRSMNHRSTTTYIKRLLAGQSPIVEREELAPRERALELLVFALRRLDGVDRAWFEERTGQRLDFIVGGVLAPLVEQNLLADDGQRVRLTRGGLLVSDSIAGLLLRSNA